MPSDGNIGDYRKYIEQLPAIEDPEVFGMHENANIAFEGQESQKMIDSILSIQPRVSGNTGVGKSADEVVYEMA